MRYNFNDISDEIIFDRDTSQPKNKLKYQRRLGRPEKEININKSSEKLTLSNRKSNFFNNNYNFNNDYEKNKKSKLTEIKENQNKEEEIINSKIDNGMNNDNETNKNSNTKKNSNQNTNLNNINNDDLEKNKNLYKNIKETQDAFVQVNFINDIIEQERKKIMHKFKERENEMRLKINELIKNIQVIKLENKKEISELKNKLDEKKEEINDLNILNNNLKKQLEKVSNKVINLNNQIIDLKNKNAIMNSMQKLKSKTSPSIGVNKNNKYIEGILNLKNQQIKDSLTTIKLLTTEKNKLENELDKVKKYNLIDPTLITLNKSLNNNNSFKNKNKYNLLNSSSQNLVNKFNINTNFKGKSKNICAPNLSINYLSKSLSKNDKNKKILQKMEKDYSIKIFKNIFSNPYNKSTNRAISSRSVKSNEISNENNKSNINKIFNDSERISLTKLFETQDEFNNFNKNSISLRNSDNSLVKKLLLKNKILSQENENKKEEVSFLQEKLKECETKLRTVNNKFNNEKYILNKNKKNLNKTTNISEMNKK